MTGGGWKREYADPGWSAWEAVAVMGLGLLLGAVPYWFSGAARGLGADLTAYFIQAGCFFLAPLFLATTVHGRSLTELGFVRPALLHCLKTGLLWGLLLYLVNILISSLQLLLFPAAAHQEYVVALLAQASPFETVFLLLLLLVLTPVAEETLFRAYFFPSLLRRYGRAAAYAVCALVFAASHLSLWTLLPIVCASLGLCRLYEKYHCLWYNIAAHVTWNGVALALYYLTR